LLGKRLARLFGLDASEWCQPDTQRTDIPGDQHVLERCQHHPPGKLHGGGVDIPNQVFLSVLCQFVAVGTEGIGLNHRGTGINVFAVDLRHQCWVGQVQRIEGLFKADPALVEKCPHGAIGN